MEIGPVIHEVKNIIQPIRYHLQLLGELKTEDPTFNRAMKIIPERLSALDQLFSRLEDLYRPMELRPARLDLCGLLRSVCQEHEDSGGAVFVVKGPEDGCYACVDEYWLRPAFSNLVLNAIEATVGQAAREICIDISSHPKRFEIKIVDNGRGIAPADLEKVFEPFYSTKSDAGAGLGLNLSKKIIEAHRGKIRIRSKPSEGTLVEIQLPKNNSAAN